MKRTIAIVSAMLMLLVALCACGSESGNGADSGNATTPQMQTGSRGADRADTDTDAKGGTNNSVIDERSDTGAGETLGEASRRAVDDVGDAVGDMVGGAVGGAAGAIEGAVGSANDNMRNRTGPTKNAGSVGRFEQMVENGRVRDSDGFLADGENKSDK